MKAGNWYFDKLEKTFYKFVSQKYGQYNFINPVKGKKRYTFYTFNPYPEYIREATIEEISINQLT